MELTQISLSEKLIEMLEKEEQAKGISIISMKLSDIFFSNTLMQWLIKMNKSHLTLHHIKLYKPSRQKTKRTKKMSNN